MKSASAMVAVGAIGSFDGEGMLDWRVEVKIFLGNFF
jgi:hypothetical protein